MRGIKSMIMKNTIKISFLLLFVSASLCADARQNPPAQPTFSGSFRYKTKSIPDSVCILSFPKKLYKGHTYFTVAVDSKGKFNFKLPKITEPIIMQIAPYEHGKIDGSMEYYVEPGDQIRFEVFDTLGRYSARFSGKGSPKYNLSEKLRLHFDDFRQRRQAENVSYDSAHLELTLKDFYTQLKKATAEKAELLAAAKTVSPAMSKMIGFEYGDYFTEWIRTLHYLYSLQYQENETVKNLIRTIYDHTGDELMVPANDLSAACPRYMIALASKIKTELYFSSKTGNVSISDYYKQLRDRYTGLLRERMIAEFIISPFTFEHISGYDPAVYDSLVNDGSKYIQSAHLKRITDDHLRLKKGAKIYPAVFKDQQDSTFSITSLKGKVVLLDIWGEGCVNCVYFHEKFEKDVYPLFKDNPNFTVLSISIDRTKEKWLRGIEGGLLTSKEYLNVHTDGLSVNHPFLKYYNITASPFLMLVDKKGLVYSKFDINLSSADLIKMISDLLAEPT
jgi:hypothetical protein